MPQLQFGLADFQIVHPTETETITTQVNTGQLEPDEKGVVRPVFKPVTIERRKRIPLPGVNFHLRLIDSSGKPQELDVQTDETGRALCVVPQSSLPQLPMEADFELVTPKGVRERGKVRVGGNEAVLTREVALQGA
jgi:hypothetical protein